MIKLINALVLTCLLVVGTTSFSGCAALPYVQTVQSWLNDPRNQALIQEIAQAANILIGAFMVDSGSATRATVAGKLCNSYPTAPAGAIAAIVKDPGAYIKH